MSFQHVVTSLDQLKVFDLLQNPIWVFDVERLQMRWANRASLRLWNAANRDELTSRDFSDVSESTHIRLQAYLKQFEQGKTLVEQWTFYPEGQPVSIHCRCSGIAIEPDRLVMLVEGIADSTHQVDQDTLRSIEALRHTSVMISLYTLDGVPLLKNPAAIRCYGDINQSYPTKENLFLSCFVDPEIKKQASQTLESGQVFSVDTQVNTLKGIRWHGLDARLTKDPVTGQTMILVNEKDITVQQAALSARLAAEAELRAAEIQLRQTNEELARATRLKDEFLANMSHELRTPLNAILGMTEGLQEAVFGEINQEQSRALKTIESSSSHLLELINDILDVAKIESGQIKLDCSAVGIKSLCQSSLVFIKQQALKKRIQVEIKLPSHVTHLPDLWVDERRIRQVLINLLNNAVKFTPEGGRIILEAIDYRSSDGKGCMQITVTDTGIGIAPEFLDKLFQPFVQIDSALNRQYTGTGLGLALVKRIVELHGGQVNVTSQVNVGSSFMISLPCAPIPHSISLPEVRSDQEIATNPLNQIVSPLILLAEDNEANISTVSSYLRAKGYQIISAKNGQEAIDLAQSERPDLILMDIQMPGLDGIEAMQQLRHHSGLVNVPIIALTALAMPEDRDRCLAAGASDYLSKPVKLKQLVTKIQQLLALA